MGSKRKAPDDKNKKRTTAQEGAARVVQVKAEKHEPAVKAGVQNAEAAVEIKERPRLLKMPSLSLRPGRATLLLGAILLLALVIRLLPMTFSIVNGRVDFAEFDPYYHMRRIVDMVQNFPSVNSFDSYVNYPYGYAIGWPPLFDLTAAVFSLVVGLGSPGRLTIEVASSIVPIIMGLLSIVAGYYLVKDIVNEKAALLSSLFMAIMLGAVYTQVFAYVGHHVLEVLGALSLYLLFMRGVSGAKGEGMRLSNLLSHKKPLAYAALAGVAMAALIFSWDGAVVYIAVVAAYAFIQYAYDAFKKESSEYLTVVGAVASAVAFVIVTPFAALSGSGQSFSFSFVYLSWFHIIFLLSMTLFFVIVGVLYKVTSDRKYPWYLSPLAVIVILAAAVAGIWLALPGLYSTLMGGVDFLTGSGSVLSAINEIEPLFYPGGQFSWAIPWTYFSTAGLLAILGLAAFVAVKLIDKKLTNGELFLLVWTAIVLVLGIMQARFVYLLAVIVAIFAGYLVYKAFELSGLFIALGMEKTRTKKSGQAAKGKPSGEAVITPPMVAVLIVAAIALAPIIWTSVSFCTSNQYYYTTDWDNACQWVDAHTPATSDVYSASQGTHPQYGIMSWWDYGDYILYEAERPAIANNFQTGVADSANFFVAQNEASANAIMDKDNAKYVMLDYRQGSPYAGVSDGIFENMPNLAGQDSNNYHMSYLMPVPYGTDQEFDGSDLYYNTMYSRLFNGDGLGGNDKLGVSQSGLQHYRLLYETNGIDPVKVFQYVKGATIEGNASPGAKVEISLGVATPYGNETYYSSTTADPAGAYSFTVPYPTSGVSGIVQTGSAYIITSGASSISVQVSQDAADNGGTINAGGNP